MDWVGDRSNGVVLPCAYLSSSDWNSTSHKTKLDSVSNIDWFNLYPVPLDMIFGGHLHCFHLLRKV